MTRWVIKYFVEMIDANINFEEYTYEKTANVSVSLALLVPNIVKRTPEIV